MDINIYDKITGMKTKHLAFCALAVVATACTTKQTTCETPNAGGLVLENLDTTVLPQNDFYQYACGGWMKLNPLTPEYARFGSFDKLAENNLKEQEAYKICEEKIRNRQLPMKLISVEYTLDVNKIIFYFTADGRIDFRELVKDLAAIFHTRIELRQIGVRDEAKLLGGIGCCGRPLCCATFLGDFEPVSIRMAKDQSLSLNPTKISGICGRLMCCLKYENDLYQGCSKHSSIVTPPKQGSRVVSIEGEGKAISINMQKRTVTVLLDTKKTIVASWEDVIEKDEDDL